MSFSPPGASWLWGAAAPLLARVPVGHKWFRCGSDQVQGVAGPFHPNETVILAWLQPGAVLRP